MGQLWCPGMTRRASGWHRLSQKTITTCARSHKVGTRPLSCIHSIRHVTYHNSNVLIFSFVYTVYSTMCKLLYIIQGHACLDGRCLRSRVITSTLRMSTLWCGTMPSRRVRMLGRPWLSLTTSERMTSSATTSQRPTSSGLDSTVSTTDNH